MKAVKHITAQLFFFLSLLLLLSNLVHAETTECTVITSLPYTISTQGIYCLKAHLATNMTSGNAITINANNVVIDLNGFKVGGLGAGASTQTTGIFANQRQNITIKNGTVRGFYVGILLVDSPPFTTSQGHLIENIRADMNTFDGIDVRGRGNIIRNNQVVDTGGLTGNTNAYGIVMNGPGARVLNNDVIGTGEQSSGPANGIYLDSAPGAVVENNRIGNSSLGTGVSYGIFIDQSGDVLASNNRVTTMTYGVVYNGQGATGKYRDNLTSGCTAPVLPGGATNAGNNN